MYDLLVMAIIAVCFASIIDHVVGWIDRTNDKTTLLKGKNEKTSSCAQYLDIYIDRALKPQDSIVTPGHVDSLNKQRAEIDHLYQQLGALRDENNKQCDDIIVRDRLIATQQLVIDSAKSQLKCVSEGKNREINTLLDAVSDAEHGRESSALAFARQWYEDRNTERLKQEQKL